MKIVHDWVDEETYIDVYLSEKDITEVLQGKMATKQFTINSQIINFSVLPELPNEEDYVLKKRKE